MSNLAIPYTISFFRNPQRFTYRFLERPSTSRTPASTIILHVDQIPKIITNSNISPGVIKDS
jgi:hypothetical protein